MTEMKQRAAEDELLSAYLDGELTAAEREHLEARLLTDPALQRELDALRRTVTLVRDLPPAPLPRNFILSPGMLSSPSPPLPSSPQGRRRAFRPWFAPSLTAATLIVALLFAIVLVNDIRFSRLPTATAPQIVGYTPGEAVATAPVTTVVEETEAEKLAVEYEATDEEREEEYAESRGQEFTPSPPALASPTFGAGRDSGLPPSPAPLVAGAAMTTATTMPPVAVAPPATEVVTAGARAIPAEGPTEETFGEQPREPSPSLAAPSVPPEEPATETVAALPGPSPWRGWVIGLGVLTLTMTGASVLAWRARPRARIEETEE